MNFLSEVITRYGKISIPEQYKSIAKIDSNILWFLADDGELNDSVVNKKILETGNSIVHCFHNVLEIDISSAFPSICKVYIKDDEFNNTIASISDKTSKLIYISNKLDGQQLRNLGYLSKTIIFGKIFESIKYDISIFEIKKDSCVISTNEDILSYYGDFGKFIDDCGISFHVKNYTHYLRYKKTSYFLDEENTLTIKGTYKYVPERLKEEIKKFFKNDFTSIKKLEKEYSDIWLKILKTNSIKKLIDYLFNCGGKCLNSNGSYIDYTPKNILSIDPQIYLKTYVFPFIIAQKI
jgi:hypothetical protein